MKPVNLNLGTAHVVAQYNFLYRSRDPDYLVQDILSIQLTSGYRIDVSWWPEHDPNGRYYLSVFFDGDDVPIEEPRELRSVDEVIESVRLYVSRFSTKIVTLSL